MSAEQTPLTAAAFVESMKSRPVPPSLDDMTPQTCPAGAHPDWAVDSEDSHTCPWCEVADLSDQLAGARRTVDEQQDEIQQLRAARPTRAQVLNDAADRIAARAAQMGAVWLRADQVCDALRRLGTEPAPVDDAERGGGRG